MQLARTVMNDRQIAEFERTRECNFAVSPPASGAFGVNAHIQQGAVGLVMRAGAHQGAGHRRARAAAGAQGSSP
jgi:Tfp pilus assembly ATPase PilU